MQHIRNFCIIAHIDHGKSTLADRLLEFTQTIKVTEGQMLDDMDLERERGITIKSHAIQMNYRLDGEDYTLNLIDTPGHVDFAYEVSRSIAACEGCLLLVDSTQGVQAQTISNLYMAIDHNLEIIPVLSKCDMMNSMPEVVEDEIIDLLGCSREDIIRASGRTGEGVEDILRAVVERIPAPKGNPDAPLQALIFDSVFNPFRGIIAYYKIVNGCIRKDEDVLFVNTQKQYHADEVGVLKMDLVPKRELRCGDVGYIVSGIKTATEVKVEASAAPVYTVAPTASPDPNKVLYYNPDGGSYYHADQNCSIIDSKYLPLKGSFLYSQRDEEAYKKLNPCANCNAPKRN